MKLSELLKEYRKTNSLTQSDIAQQLFVSKQAVSRWENDLSLPDITMYPKLSEMLGVSVDELMGRKAPQVEKGKRVSFKKIIIIIILYTLLAIEITLFVITQNGKHETSEVKNLKLASKTLNMSFSDVVLYEEVDFLTWQTFNDVDYPIMMYHFVFDKSIEKVNSKMLKELDDNIIFNAPSFIFNYFDTCDYFYYLSDKETNIATLYCLQLNNKRLIVFKYYEEVRK